MADQVKIPRSISKEEFLNQIRCGVFDALRELITSGTSTPSADFYGAIRDGVAEAMKATVRLPQNRATEPPPPQTETGGA